MTSIVDLKKSQHNRPHEFVKYLSKNHEITVVSINDWWKGGQDDLASYSASFDDLFQNINYHYLTDRKISPILQEVLFSGKIKELSKEQFDIHLNYNSLLTGYEASKKFKTVFDMADDLTEMIRASPQIPRFMRPLSGLLGNFYIKKNISNAELVILTTNNLIDAYKIPKTKSKLISNGVDIKNFYYHDNAKKELNLDDFIIGYVGVLREWVNFEPVFKALNFLENNVKFMIVGSEGNINYHKKLAKRYNVQDRVIFTGMVPYSEVPLYISAMDICLVPFETSGIAENALPLKLFEYMACERPIISTDISAVKQVVGNMILYSSDTDGYIKNINCLYDDSKLRQKLGKKGRKLVEKEYDWKVIVKELEQILINVKG